MINSFFEVAQIERTTYFMFVLSKQKVCNQKEANVLRANNLFCAHFYSRHKSLYDFNSLSYIASYIQNASWFSN